MSSPGDTFCFVEKQTLSLTTGRFVSFRFISFRSASNLVCVGFLCSDAGAYGSVYFATTLLSSVLTNNAAAALMYPIAMGAVAQTGANRLKMAMAVMLAASDYMTSFGYQTNLMVYSAGGYRNVDFLRFGTPLQIILWLSGTAILSIPDENWYIGWIVGVICLLVVSFGRLMTPCLKGSPSSLDA